MASTHLPPKAPVSDSGTVSAAPGRPRINRTVLLVTLAIVTLILPCLQLFVTVSRYTSYEEAVQLLPAILGTPWALGASVNAVLVIMCVKPSKAVSLVLAAFALTYALLIITMAGPLVSFGPFILIAVLLWLYVAGSSFVRRHVS